MYVKSGNENELTIKQTRSDFAVEGLKAKLLGFLLCALESE
jgi:hypothetical protein